MQAKQMEMEAKARSGKQDQMDMMVEKMCEQAKISDETFAETGTEQEDFEQAVMILCAKDPEVKMAMQQYMMEMQRWRLAEALVLPWEDEQRYLLTNNRLKVYNFF